MFRSAFTATPAQGLQAAAVGAAVTKRFLSHLFVRYIPCETEINELQKLADEYIQFNTEVLEHGKVRLPMRLSKQGVPTGTKGSLLIDFDTREEAENAQKVLESSPGKMPSGRPAMISQLARSGRSVFLTCNPNDPFVLQFENISAHLEKVLSEYGTVKDTKAVFSGKWPAGIYFCDFEEDDAARKAVDDLCGTRPAGLPYPLEMKINLYPLSTRAGNRFKYPSPLVNRVAIMKMK